MFRFQGGFPRRARFLFAAIAFAVVAFASPATLVAAAAPKRAVVLLVVDGLRPDYVTPDRMPRVHALAERGVFFRKHHATFPTVTRVNSATIGSGRHPAGHGILGNTIYIPSADPENPLSTSELENLKKVAAAEGELTTCGSLAEVLAANGKSLLAIGSGSAGAAYLLNPRSASLGTIHQEFVEPASLAARVAEVLGPLPPPAEGEIPKANVIRRAIDAYLKLALAELDPDATLIWITEPDSTAHATGMGSPQTDAALAFVDSEIGRLLDGLAAAGRLDSTDVLIGSDHGFSTHAGPANLTTLLVQAGLKKDPRSTDVVISGDAIHVNEGGDGRIREIVALLQKTPWVGAIFTRRGIPGHPEGFVPGTMSFHAAHWAHPDRCGDILVSANWTDEANEAGFKGTTTQTGVAGHGTSSPWDVRNTLIAAGPAFKRGIESEAPSGNVDLAPTICAILGVAAPEWMEGRPLREGFEGGPDPDDVPVAERVYRTRSEADGLRFTLDLHETGVDGTDYLDFTETKREPTAATEANP